MTSTIDDFAVKAIKKLESKLSRSLVKQALQANWPKEHALALRVKVSRSQIDVVYPEAQAEAIEDLEYGNGATSPNPVFRNFVKNNKAAIEDAISDAAVEWLEKQGV